MASGIKKVAAFFLKMFSMDSIGRPDAEAELEIRDLNKALVKHDIEIDPEVIRPLALFFNKNVTLDLKDAPITCLPSDKAKDFLRKQPKTPLLTDAQLDQI